MKKLFLATLVVAFACVGTADAKTRKLGPVESHVATFYSFGECDHGLGTQTADGSTVHWGVVASEYLPMHTLLRLTTRFHGKRYFRVRDTGAPFDVFVPCDPEHASWRDRWTNPVLRYQRVQYV